MLSFPSGATDQTIDVQIVTDAGLPVTGLVAATFPTITYSKGTGADASLSLSDLSALTDAHSDGGVKERGGGVYRLDLPDAVFSTVALVKLRGEATDKRLIAPPLQVGNLPANLQAWRGTQPAALTDTDKVQASVQHKASGVGLSTQESSDVGTLLAAITQAARVRVVVPAQLERPDAASEDYRVWIFAYNEQHEAEDLDSAPTVAVENNGGTDRSANLGSVTKPGGTTGQYYVDYTVADDHAIEGLLFTADATEGGETTRYAAAALVVDTTAVDFTSADRTKLDELHTRASEARLAELDSGNLPAAADNAASAAAAVQAKLPTSDYLAGSDNADGSIDVGDLTVNATVQPYSSTAPQRVKGSRLTLFEGEYGFWTQVQSYDANRQAVNLTGKTLRLILAANDEETGLPGTVLATLDEASDVLEKVTASSGIWRFKATAAMSPAAVENDDANWWILKDFVDGTIDETLAWGRLWVQARAGS